MKRLHKNFDEIVFQAADQKIVSSSRAQRSDLALVLKTKDCFVVLLLATTIYLLFDQIPSKIKFRADEFERRK